MQHYILLLLIILFSARTQAQQRINVRGTVYEQSTLHHLPGATVRLLDERDSLLVGGVTNNDGQYLLPSVVAGQKYTLVVSFVGYKQQRLALTLPQKSGNFKVSDILLRDDTQQLAEAVVVAKAQEVTVVEDTLVYSAAAYMVTEGAMVEELIEKMSGLVKDENGGYKINGKNVTQILVDGKEFFGNNRDMVLKNLPAEIVDKIKVYDKQSDLARITGIDDGQENTVIDLIVKKDRKRGWFGNVNAAGGTEERYSGAVRVIRFRGDQKFAMVGNAGNTQGGGNQANQSGGLTLQNTYGKLEVNGGVNGNWNQSDSWSRSNSQSFENTRAAYNNNASSNQGWNRSGGANFKFEWKPDSLTNIIFRPQASIGSNVSRSEHENASFNDDPYSVVGDPLAEYENIMRSMRVNHNVGNNHSNNSNWNVNASLQINRRLGKPGRNLTLNLDGSAGNSTGQSESYSQIDYYQILAMDGGDSIYHKIQYNDTGNKSWNWSGRLSYTEPIAEKTYLQFSYNFRYQWQDQDRTVASIFDPWRDEWVRSEYRHFRPDATPDVEQCRYVENHNYNHDIRVQLRMNRTKWNMTVGVNVRPMTNRTEYDKGRKHYDLSRSVCNWAPTLNYRYRFSRTESMELRYNGSSSQPGIQQLIPDTLNNANPLNISLGNPNLLPSFTHEMRASYNRYVQELERSFGVNLSYRNTQNGVTNRTEYNDVTGGRVSQPVNINGNWDAGADFNFNAALLADTRFRMNLGTNLRHTNHVGFVYRNKEKETVRNRTGSSNIGQTLRLTFREDYLEVNLNGGVHYNRSRSTANAAGDLDTWRFNYGGSVLARLPWNMEVGTDLTQQSRRGYSDRTMNTNELIWNLHVSQSFLKGRAATVSLRWYDVLSQRDDVSRNVSATARTDSRRSLISSYAMLNFTYRFNFFGGRGGGPRGDRPDRGGMREGGERGPREHNDGPRGGFGGGRNW